MRVTFGLFASSERSPRFLVRPGGSLDRVRESDYNTLGFSVSVTDRASDASWIRHMVAHGSDVEPGSAVREACRMINPS